MAPSKEVVAVALVALAATMMGIAAGLAIAALDRGDIGLVFIELGITAFEATLLVAAFGMWVAVRDAVAQAAA